MREGQSPESPPRSRRDLGLGLLISAGLISMLFTPLWIVNLIQVGLAGWLVSWALRADDSQLVNRRGYPRLWLFALGAAGVAANLTILRFLEDTRAGRAALALSLALLITALIIAVVRAARRFPGSSFE